GGTGGTGRRTDLRGWPVHSLRLGRRPAAFETIRLRRRAVARRDAGSDRACRPPGAGPAPDRDAGRERRDLAGHRGRALAHTQGRQSRRHETWTRNVLEGDGRDGGDLPPVRRLAGPALGGFAGDSESLP